MASTSGRKKELVKFVIPLNPIPKKNNMRIIWNPKTHRPQIIPSKRYTDYEEVAGYYINRYRPAKPYDGKLEITYKFYRDSNRRVDQTNLCESIDDILVNYGVIKDDDFKTLVSHDGTRVYVDKENPRTEVYIYELC